MWRWTVGKSGGMALAGCLAAVLADPLALRAVIGTSPDWLGYGVLVWLMLKWRHAKPGALTFRAEQDTDGLPALWWDEPRYDDRRWIFKATSVRGCCWLRFANGAWQFCYQVDASWLSNDRSVRVQVPLWQVSGFSVATAAALYGQSHDAQLRDGHHLVVRVDLDPPHRGSAFIPITFTAATPAEVENFHRVLATSFSAAMLGAAFERLMTRIAGSHGETSAGLGSGIPEQLE